MEPSMTSTAGDGDRIRLPAGMPFDQKWDVLKPVIKRLYLDEDRVLADVMEVIRAEYGFVAAESQYKYHINKKWKMKKTISTPEKDAMCRIRQSRARAGKPTVFQSQEQGKNIEEKKLRRYLKDSMRRDIAAQRTMDAGTEGLKVLSGSSFLLGNSIFLNWNQPYGTMSSSTTRGLIYPTSTPLSVSTPSDIMVTTPPTNDALSPNNVQSPLTRIQNMKEAIDRAYMFVGGRYTALVDSMRKEEKEVMSKWLYQFWFYGFKTAKHWGRGPKEWNAENLWLSTSQAISPFSLPNTPRTDSDASAYQQLLGTVPEPSRLCRWSIHYYDDIPYEPCQSRTPTPEPDPDPSNEDSWKAWPSSWQEPSYQERLLNGLSRNNFSNIDNDDIPVALPQIVKALEGSNGELIEEAFGFSIMAHNAGLLDSLNRKLYGLKDNILVEKIRELNPLHLATTYLDGSRTCCNIVNELLLGWDMHLQLRTSRVNNLGHTVFDNLMITVLKAHTSIAPGAVDDSLRDEKHFPGEEVDICGRWDADSDCIRALTSIGVPCIPFAWKHKFCHTSAQVLCHCLELLDYYSTETGDSELPYIPSGLFLKRCVSCGLKLQLQPLHTIVLTAFALAQFGTKDEDLFGMLAVLLCTLNMGADPLSVADISISALFPGVDFDMLVCNHESLRPAELANRVPKGSVESWSDSTRTGWELFCHVLQRSEKDWQNRGPQWERPDCDCEHGTNLERSLATLYAAVRTELLTYRRIKEGDPWISLNFDMHAALEGLLDGGRISIDLVSKEMMVPVCDCCGYFRSRRIFAQAEEVTEYYFSNLEDWSRTTFMPIYDRY